MALIVFNNLIGNGIMDNKRCELFSCLVVNNRKMSVDELHEQFPHIRKPTIIKNCDVLYYCTWLEKEEQEDGTISYEINRPAVRELLARCGETCDALGLQLQTLKKILGPDGVKDPPAEPAPDCGSTVENEHAIMSVTPTDLIPAAASKSAPAAPSPTVQESLNSSAVGGGPLVPATQPKNRKGANIPPSIEEVTEEARKIIADWKGHPEVIGLNPGRCAEAFIEFYESKGWVINNNQKMKCWTAALARAIHTPWSTMASSRILTPQDKARIYSCGMEKYFIEHGIDITLAQPVQAEVMSGEMQEAEFSEMPPATETEPADWRAAAQQLHDDLEECGRTHQEFHNRSEQEKVEQWRREHPAPGSSVSLFSSDQEERPAKKQKPQMTWAEYLRRPGP